METIQTLQNKIANAEDLHSVVKTMKSLAAVSIRQYEKAVESINEYNTTVELGLQGVLKAGMFNSREFTEQKGASRGIIIFGADQGMSGQFDQIISEFFFAKHRKDNYSEDTTIIALGDRLIDMIESEGIHIDGRFQYPATVNGIISVLRKIIVVIEQWREDKNTAIIEIMNNRPASSPTYAPVRSTLFPLSRMRVKDLYEKSWNSPSLPLYTADKISMAAALVREYMFVTLFRGFVESLAAENASRLSAMQAAERNIDDKLDELRNLFNQQRQRQITGELLDVISGFQALKG